MDAPVSTMDVTPILKEIYAGRSIKHPKKVAGKQFKRIRKQLKGSKSSYSKE